MRISTLLDPDVVVGRATRYDPEARKTEVPVTELNRPEATQPPAKWSSGLFIGGKAAGAWGWSPTNLPAPRSRMHVPLLVPALRR